LDRLAKEGVVLNNYYVSPLSTPSRAAFMTGKYASHLGKSAKDFCHIHRTNLHWEGANRVQQSYSCMGSHTYILASIQKMLTAV
jgi:arylsulfatase A-like enzyme